MAIKIFRPTTPSRRNMTSLQIEGISKDKPEKSLLLSKKKHAGRNSYGRITVRHHGGGNRRKYRIIDFKRQKTGVSAEVVSLQYDPNRSANIALIRYEDGVLAYIIAPEGLKAGDKVVSGPEADILTGNSLPLANIPLGTFIHNIELYPGKGAQLVRSAGSAAQLMAKENGYAQIRLPPARSDWSDSTASPPSDRSALTSTRTSRSARPDASATWAFAPRSAARS